MTSSKINPIRLRGEITPYVDVVIDGVAWKAMSPLPGIGWELSNKARPKERRFLTTAEYEELKAAERVVLVAEVQSFASLSALTPLQRQTAFIRMFWMEIVDTALAEGEIAKITRGTAKTLIEKHKDLVAQRWKEHCEQSDFDHGKPGRKKKFGSLGGSSTGGGDVDRDRLHPCAKTLVTHYGIWIESQRDFWKLVPNAEAHSSGGKEIDSRTWELIELHAPQFAGEKHATLRSICERINIRIQDLNAVLGEDNRIPLATTYGVGKAIEALPAAMVAGGRLGKKHMRQEYAHVGKGPEYKRVGEMTLHDCWTAHVINLIPENAKHLFKPDELSTRIVLAVVVDAASGAIIAIKHGVSESAALVKSALRMAVSDKTAIARAAGCNSDWALRTGVEEAKSDSGGGYRSSDFMSSVYSIADRLTFTAAGRANLRGQIERKFRTIDEDFIIRITGRTGSNILDRGRDELDPTKRASLFVDEFMKLLIRYVVDVLHYRAPQRGGLSPARKFESITGRIQCKAPPTEDEIRVAFGTLVQRKLTRAGIRFMNIIYYSGWLDIVLANRGPCTLPIRVDEENLGRISVLIGTDWTTIPGPRELEGVSLAEWMEQQAELARRHGEQARLDFDRYVAPALKDIEREARRAEEFFELGGTHWTAEMMDQAEKDLRVFMLYDRDPVGDERGLTQDSSVLGSVHGRSLPPPSKAVDEAAESPVASDQASVDPGPNGSTTQQSTQPRKPVLLQRKRPMKGN